MPMHANHCKPNVQTDITTLIDVGVVDPRLKLDYGRLERVFWWKCDEQGEVSALKGRIRQGWYRSRKYNASENLGIHVQNCKNYVFFFLNNAH